MEENKVPEENLESVDTVEETASPNATQTVENAAVESAGEAADENTENAGEYFVTSNTDEGSETKASKKTTVVLVSMILILIALIVFVGVLIFNKIRKDKEEAAQQAQLEAILAEQQEKEEASQSLAGDSEPQERIEYNVEVTLGEYKGIEAAMTAVEVTDEEVNDEIALFCEDLAEEIEVTDRAVEEGDTVNIDYAGFMGDEQFEGGTAEGYDLIIGSGSFIDGFEDGLMGHAVGEIVDVNVTFPDPYQTNPDYAGKDALFRVTINSIVEERIPEFSDELVASNTEFSTMQEYYDYIKADLESMRLEEAQAQFENDVITEAINRCSFGGQIEEQIEAYVEDYKAYNDYLGSTYYGVDGATLFMYFYGMDAETYDSYIREQAAYEAKYTAMLDKIIEVENLTATQEEYDETFNEIFIDYYGYSSREEVLLEVSEEELDDMVNTEILQNKAKQIIIDNAVIIE